MNNYKTISAMFTSNQHATYKQHWKTGFIHAWFQLGAIKTEILITMRMFQLYLYTRVTRVSRKYSACSRLGSTCRYKRHAEWKRPHWRTRDYRTASGPLRIVAKLHFLIAETNPPFRACITMNVFAHIECEQKVHHV